MTKEQIIELTKEGVNLPVGIKNRTIGFHIENSFIQLSKDIFGKNLHQLDLYTKSFPSRTVNYIEDENLYWVAFPAPIMQTLDWFDGIRRIKKMKGSDVDFEPLFGIQDSLINELEAGKVYDKIMYVVRNGRIEFINFNNDIETVKIEMIPTFSFYDDEDDFPLPQGIAQNIIALARASYQNNPNLIRLYSGYRGYREPRLETEE